MLTRKYQKIAVIKLFLLCVSIVIFGLLTVNYSQVSTQDTVFIIDLSDSMNKNNRLDQAKNTIISYRNMDKKSAIGIIVFDAKSYYFLPNTADINIFETYIQGLQSASFSGDGNDILSAIREFNISNGVGTKCFIISDGIDNDVSYDELSQLKHFLTQKSQGISVIGWGNDVLLGNLASNLGGRYINLEKQKFEYIDNQMLDKNKYNVLLFAASLFILLGL